MAHKFFNQTCPLLIHSDSSKFYSRNQSVYFHFFSIFKSSIYPSFRLQLASIGECQLGIARYQFFERPTGSIRVVVHGTLVFFHPTNFSIIIFLQTKEKKKFKNR